MKQVIQNYKTGELAVKEVPVPLCKAGGVLVRNMRSLISAGTERGIIELGRKSLLGKAKARPDLVRRALAKAKREGLLKTFKEAMGRLDEPTALGYSCAGVIEEVGRGVKTLSVGQRVACIGAGFASHAQTIWVPEHLCAVIPETVSFDEACFGMLGIIALHGVRCAKVELGWRVGVIGLGLLGQLTVQILAASGADVLAIDLDGSRVELAKKLGARAGATVGGEDVASIAKGFSKDRGLEAVIITAAAKDRRPLDLASEIAAARSRVVLVGVCAIEVDRKVFWEKEIEFMVSRAGGAGTFDSSYEVGGVDYPVEYVRWTQQRNLEEFLRLVEAGKVQIEPLISRRFSIAQALEGYKLIESGQNGCIGVLLEYAEQARQSKVVALGTARRPGEGRIGVGVVGAGVFARALLLPELAKVGGVDLRGLATTSGAGAEHLGRKFGFEYCCSDYERLLEDENIEAVFVLTRHDVHKRMVCRALEAGKSVFVEKPLCLSEEELGRIEQTYAAASSKERPIIMVGYNRRFARLVRQGREFFANRQGPMMVNIRVNAGAVPSDHWVHDKSVGGGRLLSEGCHFVDLAGWLCDSKPVKVYAQQTESHGEPSGQNVCVIVNLADGSLAQILYTAGGHRAFSRERIEMFADGAVFVIDDFRLGWQYRATKSKKLKLLNQDMGYVGELAEFFAGVKGERQVPGFESYARSTLATIRADASLRGGKPMNCEWGEFI